jgi:cell division protein FtsL
VNDILKKIDELIDKTNYELYKAGLEDAKDIILSQYKELATDNNVVTIGDKIRENNESLAEYISKFTILADRQRIIDYLNQPYME